MPRIAVIPGDGIGIDVTREAVKVLQAVADVTRTTLQIEEFDYGAEKYLATGISLPDEDLEKLKAYDAIFIGALGDPRIPDMAHARDILLGTRFKLDLYVGIGGIFKKGTPDEVAIQEDVNTRKGVERILRHAFEFARRHGRRSVCMTDKSNALRHGGDLWQRAFKEVAADYPDMPSFHLFVDALAMQLVRAPENFDVIVTNNMFGDILTDLGAALQGGLGMAASGNVHPGRHAMFEPVHGSAPKYAGKDVANPFAAILAAEMMLEHFGLAEAGDLVQRAVVGAIADSQVTKDLGGALGTRAAGDEIVRRIRALAG